MITKIDFDALLKNAKVLKNRANGAKLCCVVKCNAYGHGLVQTARFLQDIADCFAVSRVQEANSISYLKKDILLLIPQDREDTLTALKNNFILTIDSFHTLDIISSVAKQHNLFARAHLKIDSGMNRLGFFSQQLPVLCERLANLPCIVEGVFSHFSSADTSLEFSNKQFFRFLDDARFVESKLNCTLTKHIANTSGLFLSKKFALDMVRCGLGLYGYGGANLTPVKTITTRVLAVKVAKKGEFVSYNNTFECKSDTKLAILDVGYANGLSQQLSKKMTVLIDGKCAPILGKICMGVCAADASGIDVSAGDFVTLLGAKHNPSIGNDISIYELLCNLN